MHRDPQETVKMIQSQQQPQLEQVVNMLDSAKDLLDQHKPQAGGKTFPNISMQTERKSGFQMAFLLILKLFFSTLRLDLLKQ